MRRISRRTFNRMAAAAGALTVLPFGSASSQVRFVSPPFQLGVASGDPSADGFVIWTRLAPEPFDTTYLGQTIFERAQFSSMPKTRRNGCCSGAPEPASMTVARALR